MLVFTCWERSWGRSREYLRAGVVELVFGWPESPSGYIATRSPFLTNCDIERRFPTSLRCRRLMEVDLRQMAISLTVEERPL